MERLINPESIATALVIAIIFAFVKLFRDVDHLRTTTEPLVEWWRKVSMDALKIATNPTSERLTWLGDKYREHVVEGRPMSASEKQELIDGLREILNDPKQFGDKRQSASTALRFIEGREGLTARRAANSNH